MCVWMYRDPEAPVHLFLRDVGVKTSDFPPTPKVSFKKEAKDLYQHFLTRGYPKKHLKRAYWRAKHSTRDSLLGNEKEEEK